MSFLMKCPDWDLSHFLKRRWNELLSSRCWWVWQFQRWKIPWVCPGAVLEHSGALLSPRVEIRQLTCIQLQREQAGGCSPGCVRALQLPWEHCEILHRDKYLVIWGLDGEMAVPATQCPRPLNCYRRRVIIERGRCFLINYVNPAAAQPSCIFSNIIPFVAQLLSVLWATANLKKL